MRTTTKIPIVNGSLKSRDKTAAIKIAITKTEICARGKSIVRTIQCLLRDKGKTVHKTIKKAQIIITVNI